MSRLSLFYRSSSDSQILFFPFKLLLRRHKKTQRSTWSFSDTFGDKREFQLHFFLNLRPTSKCSHGALASSGAITASQFLNQKCVFFLNGWTWCYCKKNQNTCRNVTHHSTGTFLFEWLLTLYENLSVCCLTQYCILSVLQTNPLEPQASSLIWYTAQSSVHLCDPHPPCTPGIYIYMVAIQKQNSISLKNCSFLLLGFCFFFAHNASISYTGIKWTLYNPHQRQTKAESIKSEQTHV